MKLLKKVSILFLILLVSGCDKNKKLDMDTINYSLKIDTKFHENITFVLAEDAEDKAKKEVDEEHSSTSLEYSLLIQDENNPIKSNYEEIYNKTITKEKGQTLVNLIYDFKESDYLYNRYINNCFENYDLVSNDYTFVLKLSGEFYCLYDKKLNIEIDSNYKVISSNGKYQDKKYTWTIDSSNYKDVNIEYEILRDYEEME